MTAREYGRVVSFGGQAPVFLPSSQALTTKDRNVKERPILFSGPMVRAILDGRKTVTRRLVRPSVKGCTVGAYTNAAGGVELVNVEEDGDPWTSIPCPYGQPGDRLWVKSKWLITDLVLKPSAWSEDNETCFVYKGKAKPEHAPHVRYAAELKDPSRFKGAFRSSLMMPRWASRLTIEVTGVRAERLQAITEDGARAEGVEGAMHRESWLCVTQDGSAFHMFVEPDEEQRRRWNIELVKHSPASEMFSAREAFARLWDGLNGGRAPWASNPWVWVVEFRRLEP